jgi:hypothetical protein
MISKYFSFLIVVVFLFSCATTKINTAGAKYKIPKDLDLYLSEFENTVKTHNQSQVLNFMDPDYIREQLDDFLDGRKEQFLNEFFCGMQTNDHGFYCPEFDDITKFEFESIEKTDDGMYRVVYLITSDNITVRCDWGIMAIPTGVVYQYGLVGASG